MDANTTTDLEQGAANLLVNCAGTQRGDDLLLVCEPANLDYYEPELVGVVADCGRAIGANVRIFETPFDPEGQMSTELEDAMQTADVTVFLARIGDQIRFSDIGTGRRIVVSYALSRALLGCRFGTADHDSFIALKDAVDQMAATAETIEITCPAGTSIRGRAPSDHATGGDVSIRRFPMLVPTPVLANGFSGRAAMPGFLVGTGSKYYQPYECLFEGPLLAYFEEGRITGFEGSAEDVNRAKTHYRFVADKYGIDADFVHSWHAGIHPGSRYDWRLEDSYERWSGAAFGNPRLLHFHTCGAYAPGEISWNIVDPTVSFDGVRVWENGRLLAERVPGGVELLEANGGFRAAFDSPATEIGF